jgi:hypothetical protein
MIGTMAFDPNALMHDGTWLSVFGVVAAFIAFYIARSTIQFIYSVWPFGKIKALREAPKIVGEWQVASSASHLHARAQVVRRLNEATDALAKQIIQTKLSGVAATIANFAQGIIGVIMLMSYVRSKVAPDTVGIWSVVVLGASLFKRVFNLDTVAEKAKKDTDKLDALIRYGQDKLAALDARSMQGQDRTDALLLLVDEITAQLTQIINPGAEVPKPPEPQMPSVPAAPLQALQTQTLGPSPQSVNPAIKYEDPRLLAAVEPLNKDGEGFKGAVGVVLTNVGGSKAHNLHLEDIILTQKTIEFPDNISALASGAKTHPIAGTVTGFGPLQMFDIAAAMMAEWDHQPKALAEVIPCPASATYEDFNHNRFKATWIWEFHPFRYRQWVSRVRKQTDGWLPDTIGPYLTASAIHTERIPREAADNSVISSASHNAGASR